MPLKAKQLTSWNETKSGISWMKHHELKCQSWREDVTEIHHFPISELQVDQPTMIFSGWTANAMDALLTATFYSSVLITPSTSVTLHSLQHWFLSRLPFLNALGEVLFLLDRQIMSFPLHCIQISFSSTMEFFYRYGFHILVRKNKIWFHISAFNSRLAVSISCHLLVSQRIHHSITPVPLSPSFACFVMMTVLHEN